MKTLKHEKKNKKKDKIITYDYGKYIGKTNENKRLYQIWSY